MNLKRTLLAAAMLIAAMPGHGQGYYSRASYGAYLFSHYDDLGEGRKTRLKRYYFGYVKPSMKLDIVQHYVADGSAADGVWPVNTNVETITGAGSSYGEIEGTFFPIYRMRANRAIAIDLASNYEAFTPKIGPINYGGSVSNLTDDGLVMMVSMPIGIVYKSGGEISLSKHDKVLFTVGCGMAPTLAISKILTLGSNFALRRYLVAEFGMFTGIAWKLRATYFPGNFTLFNVTGDDMSSVSKYYLAGPQGVLDVSAVARNDFNIALVILPFSFHWDD